MKKINYVMAYQSINYLATYSGWITGIAAAGVVISILRQGMQFYTEGAEAKEIFIKIKKRFVAGIILILLTALIELLKGYYM